MNVTDLIHTLRTMGACHEATSWLGTLPADASAYAAWRGCQRGDWLVWLVTQPTVSASAGDRALRLIACDCAEQALSVWETWAHEHVPSRLDAPRRAVNVARAYAMGEATRRQLIAAGDAARAAARDAARAAAEYVAWATVWATAGDAARVSQARIVRRHVAWSTVRDALDGASDGPA